MTNSLEIKKVSKIHINNFKSIKDMNFESEKINLFIGEPNVGKSNILESLAFVSMAKYSVNFDLTFVRFIQMVDLIYNQDFTKTVKITFDDLEISIRRHSENDFIIEYNLNKEKAMIYYNRNGAHTSSNFDFNFKKILPDIKFYRFVNFPENLSQNDEILLPYKGENLLNVITKNKEIEEIIKLNIGKYGLRLITDRSDNRIKLLKDEGDEIVALPFKVLSDGLQRHLFNQTALLSNKNSIIVMEEPESHTFPFMTKNFSEMLAKDETNQFFITTHNPYFVNSIIEKTKKENLGIFIVYFKDYQTKIKKLTKNQIKDLLNYDYDLFFNLDQFIE
jgi:hypothetical protein